jgi:adenylate cyclase, class 2
MYPAESAVCKMSPFCRSEASCAITRMVDPTETEVKIRVPNLSDIQHRLRSSGFLVSEPREFEANTLYETADGGLARRGMLLRLRQAGGHAVITWKGPGEAGPYKSRPELETSIGSLETLQQILEHLGYQPSFRYEKYRTEFRTADGAGVVTTDETPIGDFLELEGPGAWIDETAQTLGFSRRDYILASYGRLYLADCERRGVEPGHMVFASHP